MRQYDSLHTATADDCSYVPIGVQATSTTDAPLSVEINGTTHLSVSQYRQQLLPTGAVCDGIPHTDAAGTNSVSRACTEEPSLGPGAFMDWARLTKGAITAGNCTLAFESHGETFSVRAGIHAAGAVAYASDANPSTLCGWIIKVAAVN